MNKRATFNELGYRVGETRKNAVLTDDDVRLVLILLHERQEVIDQCTAIDLSQAEIDKALNFKQLSYRWIADKFEVSKATIQSIANGRTRCHNVLITKRGK